MRRRHIAAGAVVAAVVFLAAGCGGGSGSSGPGTIAFTTTRDGNAEVYTVRSDGSGLENVTSDVANDGQPAWSPDGTKLAFVSTRDTNGEIYVMNADGTGLKRLTRLIAGQRDGADLVARRHDDRDAVHEGEDGRPHHRHLRPPRGRRDGAQPHLGRPVRRRLPDLVAEQQGHCLLERAPEHEGPLRHLLDPRRRRQGAKLSNQSGGAGEPAFSPDGTELAFIGTASRSGTGGST